jgi:hypothetical protein
LWHDRAVFHFLTDPADRATYRDLAASTVAPGGFLIVATFALDGPTHCSGLPVARYGSAELAAAFAPCGVPEVGPGSLTSSNRHLGMTLTCRCGCCT